MLGALKPLLFPKQCWHIVRVPTPKRLSIYIAHWKALGESYLLSHKSSSGGGGGGVMAARRNKDKMVKHCLSFGAMVPAPINFHH